MNKIIKRTVSAMLTAAFAVSGVSALAFTDMQDTEQSTIMEKIGVISGYEDGSFKPDNDVTRAEAAAIIVRAIGWQNEDIDEYKRGMLESPDILFANKDNKVIDFSDYNPNHWANVYIQIAMDNDIIAGFDDGTFKPDENVTTEQMLTMLTKAVGYGTFAEAAGGYPNGYIQWAVSEGIAEDIKPTDYKRNAKRSEVLKYVANCVINAPICVIDRYETQWNGVVVPLFMIKDGEGKDWQTLLIRMFDIYTGTGEITKISDKEITATITSSRNFADEYATKDNPVEVKITADDNSKTLEKGKNYKLYVKQINWEPAQYELVAVFPAE